MNSDSPIMMKMPGKLRFSAEGRWFHQDSLVTHPNIQQYFTRHLRFDAKHDAYLVEVDGKAVEVEVELCPRVVKDAELSNHTVLLSLNDGSEMLLGKEGLYMDKTNRLYCKLENERETLGEHAAAAFLRSAAQRLYPWIEIELESEGFCLQLPDTSFPIRFTEEPRSL